MDNIGKSGHVPFGEDDDPKCQIAINRFLDAYIELARHYKVHHEQDESMSTITIGLMLAPANPQTGIVLIKDMVQRLAERGYSEDFPELGVELMKSGGMLQGVIAMMLISARNAVESGEIKLASQDPAPEEGGVVHVDDLPEWLRSVMNEIEKQPDDAA